MVPQHHRISFASLLLGCCFLFGAIGIPPLFAQTSLPNSLRASASQGHVTIIILDMSGSMAQNDPQGIRCSAANAFIDLSGPGSFIGVINLDGSQADPTHAFVLAPPAEMATIAAHTSLKNAIATKTNNCKPDNETPTQDALRKAKEMLDQATQGGTLAGSVILLTDGAPDPNGPQQQDAIAQQLLPIFAQHNWPIDVVALGQNQTPEEHAYHQFLNGISSATRGTYYDDGKGIVPNVSPLNIAPFFVDIFAQRNGRVPGPTIAPTTLQNNTVARDFTVGPFVDHLDVIAVKDQPATKMRLFAPNGTEVTPGILGTTLLSGDPYYTIFSIAGPPNGTWELRANGSGAILMDSFAQSALQVTITQPTNRADALTLPLGEPFTVAAKVMHNAEVITGNTFRIGGTISFAGSGEARTQAIPLSETPVGSGIYSGPATIPPDGQPGTYNITVTVSQISNVPLSSASQSVSLIHFPRPVFLQDGVPAQGTATATVTHYDPVLRFLYTLPILTWLSQPVLGQNARPMPTFPVQVRRDGQRYCATDLTASALPPGSTRSLPVTITKGASCGTYTLAFPTDAQGDYLVTFKAYGAAADTFGLPSTTTLNATIHQRSAAIFFEEIWSWMKTFVWLVMLALFGLLAVNKWVRAQPAGRFVVSGGAPPPNSRERGSFTLDNFSLMQKLFAPNRGRSEQFKMPAGLLIRFRRDGSFTVKPDPTSSIRLWQLTGTKNVASREVEILYQPQEGEPLTYHMQSGSYRSPSKTPARVAAGEQTSSTTRARDRAARDRQSGDRFGRTSR